MRSTIICVDDEKMLLNVLSEQLEGWFGQNYTIEKALGGEEALAILEDCRSSNIDVSVVISDYVMPQMKGDELLAKIKEIDPKIRKIMLTGYSSLDGIVNAINKAGLYRYLTKPWDSRDLMLTILEAIKSYENEKKAYDLSRNFENLYRDTESNYYNALGAMLDAITMRTGFNAGHSQRISELAYAFGKELKISENDLKFLKDAAIMHDVGLLALSDAEVSKVMQMHIKGDAAFVKRQAECTQKMLYKMNNADRIIKTIRYHFEHHDGSGPFGLSDIKIPFESRIIGLVNYYDLIQNCSPEKPYTKEAVLMLLENCKGKMFEPMLVDIFVKMLKNGSVF